MLSFFPRDVLDEILNLIESVSEGFPTYSFSNESLRLLNGPALGINPLRYCRLEALVFATIQIQTLNVTLRYGICERHCGFRRALRDCGRLC